MPFHHFWRFFLLWLVCFLLFVSLDEDCNPGWRDCGRPLRFCVVCCTEDGELVLDFLFICEWIARFVAGVFFAVFSCLMVGKLMSVLLLVTRLGLMPCSAWSKKRKDGGIAVVRSGFQLSWRW